MYVPRSWFQVNFKFLVFIYAEMTIHHEQQLKEITERFEGIKMALSVSKNIFSPS